MCTLLVANIVYSLVLKHVFVNMLLMVRNELEVPGGFVAFSLIRDNEYLVNFLTSSELCSQ